MRFPTPLRLLVPLAASVALASPLAAQLPINGSVFDGVAGGGPLQSGVVYHVAWLLVPAGQTLTIQPGAILKCTTNAAIQVDGTLRCLGTAAQPVIVTSIHDDAAGGDTNGNGGASVPAAGQWQGITFANSDASALDHTVIRYAGASNQPAIRLADSDLTMRDGAITDVLHGGICMTTGISRPTVTRCRFERVDGDPCVFGTSFGYTGCDFGAVAGFTANTAANCPGGGYIRVDVATFPGTAVISPANCINGAIVYSVWPRLDATNTLQLLPGTVLKATGNNQWTVGGTLRCDGTAAAPVVFTSLDDDAAGGDTNGDGTATAGAPGQWQGMQFEDPSDASTLAFTTIRYTGAGQGNWAAVRLVSADIAMQDCTISDTVDGGIEFVQGNSRPTVERCRFERIQGLPAVSGSSFSFSGCDFGAAAGFVDNVAVACNAPYLRIDVFDNVGAVALGPRNGIGSVVVVGRNVRIPQGASLTLLPGTVLKGLDYNATIQVDGGLTARGAFLTSLHDDAVGGDTNGNGAATQPGPNQWGGVDFTASATGILERVFLGYGGYPASAVRCASSNVVLRSCVVHRAGNIGFDLANAAAAEDLTAFGCGNDGFRLLGGTFALRRCTSVGNGGYGFEAAFSTVNEVRSSIAWNNTGAAFSGFGSGRVHYSNGAGISAGTGNTNVDPRFVAPSVGDLRLQPGSPCVDAGDPADAPLSVDLLGTPRWLDGDLDGSQRVDMGALERDNVMLAIAGTPHPGSSLQMALQCAPQIVLAIVVFGRPLPQPLPLFSLGTVLVDVANPIAMLTVPPQWQAPLVLPATLQPMTLVVQAAGFTAALPVGNVSNPVTLRIE